MPTNTTQMNYDTTRHLYVLNVAYLKSEMGIDLEEREGSLTRAKEMLSNGRELSIITSIIINSKNKRLWEYYLAFDEDVRTVIQNCLEEQARYEWESNASMLEYQLVNGVKMIEILCVVNVGLLLLLKIF